LLRFGQNQIHTVYTRDFGQENHQIYGHIRCIYTVLANSTFAACHLEKKNTTSTLCFSFLGKTQFEPRYFGISATGFAYVCSLSMHSQQAWILDSNAISMNVHSKRVFLTGMHSIQACFFDRGAFSTGMDS
jgi:hypothetical protein